MNCNPNQSVDEELCGEDDYVYYAIYAYELVSESQIYQSPRLRYPDIPDISRYTKVSDLRLFGIRDSGSTLDKGSKRKDHIQPPEITPIKVS